MKTFLLITLSLLAFNSFAGVSPCKSEAVSMAGEKYVDKYGDSQLVARSKYPAVVEKSTITHYIEVTDTVSQRQITVSVTLDKNSCKLQ